MLNWRYYCMVVCTVFTVCCLSACGTGLWKKKEQAITPKKNLNPCVVLALPTTGAYATFASKVSHGAQLAKQELTSEGINVNLKILNTESPSWLKELNALPNSCTIVGGPMSPKAYTQARSAGLLEKRTFFAFLNNLEHGDEGQRAWRFFPGPQDQIDALLSFAVEGLKIRSFGAFAPSDTYGLRMTELLEKSLKAQNIPLHKVFYAPNNRSGWKSALNPLLKPMRVSGRKNPVPQTDFEALFLPDSWKYMDKINAGLLANGEDRLVLLGTTLWEQGLAGKRQEHPEKFALAVFPAAWDNQKKLKILSGQRRDFWLTLGYDFTRFGAGLALDARPTKKDLLQKANSVAKTMKVLAPIHWDNSGLAHEKLLLYHIVPTGMQPVELKKFKDTRTVVLEKALLRLNLDDEPVYEEKKPQKTIEKTVVRSVNSPTPPVQASPVRPVVQERVTPKAPVQPITSQRPPQTSYKLRLPSRPAQNVE